MLGGSGVAGDPGLEATHLSFRLPTSRTSLYKRGNKSLVCGSSVFLQPDLIPEENLGCSPAPTEVIFRRDFQRKGFDMS